MMPTILSPATAIIVLLSAAPVLGAAATSTDATAKVCSDALAQLETEVGENRQGGGGRDIRTLHEAAMIFGRNGQGESCERVVDGIRQYMRSAGTTSAGAQTGGSTTANFEQRLASARPLSEMQGTIRMSDLIGAEVVSAKGGKLGDVDDVVMSPGGDTRYLLVGTGGFLELGEKYVPVRADEIRMIDRDTLVLDVPETAFQDAPRFDMETIQSKTAEWSDDIAAWWKANVTDRMQ